jgi:hypothetical protein
MEVIQKRKKFLKRLRKRVYERGSQKTSGNCKYWVDSIPGDAKCTFNIAMHTGNKGLRECPHALECQDFFGRYTGEDLEKKFRALSVDDNYLAQNYRDLLWMNWMLESPEYSGTQKFKNWCADLLISIKDRLKWFGFFSKNMNL